MLCSLCGHDIDAGASVTDDVRDGRTGRCRLVCFSMHISFLTTSFGSTVSFFSHFPCCIFLILWEDVAPFSSSLVTILAFLLFLFLTHVVSVGRASNFVFGAGQEFLWV